MATTATTADLVNASNRLETAFNAVEQVHLRTRKQIDLDMKWMLAGFTDDALVELHEMTRMVMEIREGLYGGLTEGEYAIVEAFGAR